MRHLRKIFFKFEIKTYQKVSESEKFLKDKLHFFVFLQFFDLPEAQANSSNKCVIGGIERTKRNGFCPTRSRACGRVNNTRDTFKCGVIYNNKCITRKPVRNLSHRCHEAGEDSGGTPDVEKYNRYKRAINDIYGNYCGGQEDSRDNPCGYLTRRVRALREHFTSPTREVSSENCARYSKIGTEATFCHDCRPAGNPTLL